MSGAVIAVAGTILSTDLLCGSCGCELIGGFVKLMRDARPRPVFRSLTLPCPRCQALNTSPEVPDNEGSAEM